MKKFIYGLIFVLLFVVSCESGNDTKPDSNNVESNEPNNENNSEEVTEDNSPIDNSNTNSEESHTSFNILVDFGEYKTNSNAHYWNFISGGDTENQSFILNDENGKPTECELQILNPFKGNNGNSPQNISASFYMPYFAYGDNIYGSSNSVSTLSISGLDPDIAYTLSIFASRNIDEVKNRETAYTIKGKNIGGDTKIIDCHKNTKNTAEFTNIYPSNEGTITIDVTGTSNNNSNYTYIGTLKIGYGTEAKKFLKILPLGDSITQGNSHYNSYRKALYDKLKLANYPAEFIGSMYTNHDNTNAPNASEFDIDHEGHWGWRADEILNKSGDNITLWLESYTPDVVLMHLGTNDAYKEPTYDPSSTINELKSIITEIRKDNPKVIVLVAKLIPIKDESKNSEIDSLNDLIPDMVTDMNSVTSPVVLVDQSSGYNAATDNQSDGVHPNTTGEEKIAQKWFDALVPFFEKI